MGPATLIGWATHVGLLGWKGGARPGSWPGIVRVRTPAADQRTRDVLILGTADLGGATDR